jgi:hypothetical protein
MAAAQDCIAALPSTRSLLFAHLQAHRGIADPAAETLGRTASVAAAEMSSLAEAAARTRDAIGRVWKDLRTLLRSSRAASVRVAWQRAAGARGGDGYAAAEAAWEEAVWSLWLEMEPLLRQGEELVAALPYELTPLRTNCLALIGEFCSGVASEGLALERALGGRVDLGRTPTTPTASPHRRAR